MGDSGSGSRAQSQPLSSAILLLGILCPISGVQMGACSLVATRIQQEKL